MNVALGVPLGERTVGIVLHEEDILVFGGVIDSGCGIVLDDTRPQSAVVDGRTVVAGLLPEGATRVFVIDDRGDEFEGTVRAGMYVAVASEAGLWDGLVRFEDEQRALVAQPLPPGRRRAVTDAPEPCPVCTAAAWVEIDEEVLCGTCGLCVGEAIEPDDDGPWDEPEERSSEPVAFPGFAFPVYVARGGTPQISAWFLADSQPGDVIAHDDPLHVATGAPRTVRVQLAEALNEFDPKAQRSGAGLRVHEADTERTARRLAAHATVEEREFEIDGRREPFAFLAAADAWAATREHDGVHVAVWARGVDPESVALERFQPID